MKIIKYIFMILLCELYVVCINAQSDIKFIAEEYRPQIHFSPIAGWMNDPNGMVYYKGTYHLFFQYYPHKTIWGPMHWGHATSKDLIHWQQQPIALYPDTLGYIFSGSAVVDYNSTSGFGKSGITPLVAIFTHHNSLLEKTGSNKFQNQSLAYSLNDGKSWVKYKGNPVLNNPGIIDFRDPKVMWLDETKEWIMTLATKDCVTFYSSKNLKNWTKESEFGKTVGSHTGVWECPDLFYLNYQGKKIWVLLVSMNPGGPNGGSATQYFIGDFDGKSFSPFQTDTKWIDYGRDNYAGITWSNTNNRKVFMGWMSNWQYADKVPTKNWRSATTIPRDLAIQKVRNSYFVTSQPVKELNNLIDKRHVHLNIKANNYIIREEVDSFNSAAKIHFSADKLESFSFTLSNDLGENVVAGYNKNSNKYYIDRANSGKVDFEKSFGGQSLAPRLTEKNNLDITIIMDKASIELFADGGLSVMTDIFFPNKPFNKIEIKSANGLILKKLEYSVLKSIWE